MVYQIAGLLFGLAVFVHYVLFMVLLPALLERWLDDDDARGCTVVEQKPLN